MARKLRFFKEQMTKSGVAPSPRPITRADIDLDDLEVQVFSEVFISVQVFSKGFYILSIIKFIVSFV